MHPVDVDAYIISFGGHRFEHAYALTAAFGLNATHVQGIRTTANLTLCRQRHDLLNVTLRRDCMTCQSGRLVAKQCYGNCEVGITDRRLHVLEGMRLAHVEAWRAIVASGRDAIIFEDDIDAGPGSSLVDPKHGMTLQSAVDYLRHRRIQVGFVGGCAYARCCQTAMCAHALWMTPAAALAMLDYSRPCMAPDLGPSVLCATTLACRKFVTSSGQSRELFVQDKVRFPPHHTMASVRARRLATTERWVGSGEPLLDAV